MTNEILVDALGSGQEEVVQQIKVQTISRGDNERTDCATSSASLGGGSESCHLLADDDLRVQFIPPESVTVIQGRAIGKVNRDNVESIRLSIHNQVEIPPVVVYQDSDNGGKYAPNGSHRQAAYSEEGLPLKAVIRIVKNAKERAEAESCKANADNGLGRSNQDKLHQAGNAVKILEVRLGRPPKPKELAEFTLTSQKFCNGFLCTYYSPKPKKSEEPEMDSKIPRALESVLDSLTKIIIPEEWESGEITEPILANIGKQLQRFKSHNPHKSEITVEDLSEFMTKHNFTVANMGKLLQVDAKTINRWVKGKAKMSASNMRILRQVMSMEENVISALLEEDGDNG